MNFSGYNQAIGQPTSEISIGNTSSEASDTFFQLDNSIEIMKSLVNETQASLDNGNTTEALDFLNQIYNELIQIANNSNNSQGSTSSSISRACALKRRRIYCLTLTCASARLRMRLGSDLWHISIASFAVLLGSRLPITAGTSRQSPSHVNIGAMVSNER